MKISVIYHSETGNTKKAAEFIAAGAAEVENTEAKCFSIDSIDEEFVKSSDAVIVGCPTYNGALSGKMKMWLEGCGKYKMAGKLAGAFATAGYIHGGGDLAVQCILTHLMVEGMMAYSGGYAYGAPVIHLGPVGISPDMESYAELMKLYGHRMAAQTAKIFK